MHSAPPTRAPKSQLDVEQPLTSGNWNSPQRRIPTSKEKEAAATRWYEGYNQDEIKSHILRVSDPHTGEYQGISPTIVNILNPNVRVPNLGIQQRD